MVQKVSGRVQEAPRSPPDHIKKHVKHMKIPRINEYLLRGSGGPLGASWTFLDTCWTILEIKTKMMKIVPEDLKRPPRHIPDDPKKVIKISKHILLFFYPAAQADRLAQCA